MERKSTAVISFSCDLETMNYLDSYQVVNKVNRSTAIRYHIRMGRTYLKMLDDYEVEIPEPEPVDTAKNGAE